MKKIFIKILLLLLVLSMLAPLAAPSASAATTSYFTDVSTESAYCDAVNYLYEHGIMNGISANTFAPESSITRGQLVTMLWRMLSKPAASKVAAFTDCKSSDWFYPAVQWAQSVGIASGCGDGKFCPNKALTNQELFLFLYRFVKYCGYKMSSASTYTDVFRTRFSKRQTYWTSAYAAAGWVYKESLMDSRNLSGTALCSRGNTANLIYNIYKKYQKKYALTILARDYCSSEHDLDTLLANWDSFFRRGGVSAVSSAEVIPDYQDPYMGEIRLSDIMTKAFGSAKRLDLCYMFLGSHGDTDGLYLFNTVGVHKLLTPATLRKAIDKHLGTFVVMISACSAGIFISKNGGTNLRGSHRIKVLCSSREDRNSCGDRIIHEYAMHYWTLGCGYDVHNGRDTRDLPADILIPDSRISLQELYTFSREEVARWSEQEVVCYPENDNTIIYEFAS